MGKSKKYTLQRFLVQKSMRNRDVKLKFDLNAPQFDLNGKGANPVEFLFDFYGAHGRI